MCGRFTQQVTWQEIRDVFGVPGPPADLHLRDNVTPGQNVVVVRSDRSDGGALEDCRIAMLRWGLIPSWAKDPGIGKTLINARAETVDVKPSFRDAYRERRCLIPADGFYEWKRHGAATQPYRILNTNGSPMAFAGLWERWTVRDGTVMNASFSGFRPGDVIETCTIITTTANDVVAPIHHRMPVILPPEAFHRWLVGETVPLSPCPSDTMAASPVDAPFR